MLERRFTIMAKKLTDIYNAIMKEGGLQMTMRLAIMTGVPSAKAATEPDAPDTLKKFAAAYKEITGKNCPIN
jgi:hypothetical protein